MPKKLRLQSSVETTEQVLQSVYRKPDYSDWSTQQLIVEVERLRKNKKYGLVWEPIGEDVVKSCKKQLPVLKEVKNRAVVVGAQVPTNIFIEGDNYHALSVLNYTHRGKIDVIYIDPPYNTGRKKEWKFNDKWIDKYSSYRHSKWLSFISKRLQLAKQLLKVGGVILISIDDNEYAQLKLLCDNLFAEKQFIGSLVWEKKKKGSYLDGGITNVKEYVLAYSKNADFFGGLIGEVNEERETYPCLNPGNGYSTRIIPSGTKSTYKQDISLPKGYVITVGTMKLTLLSTLKIEDARLKGNTKIEAEWRYDQESINQFSQKHELYFTQDLYLRRIVTAPRHKKLKDLLLRTSNSNIEDYLRELIELHKDKERNEEKIESLLKNIRLLEESDYDSEINPNNLYTNGWGSNEDGDNEQRDFFGKKVFDYPKPTRLIEKLIAATRISSGVVLDFFAGSGTTAHAVMKLNKKGKNIQYILCTNNEDNDGNGMRIASDICYPRVKKVIEGYKNRNGEMVAGLGGNLKYFRTAFVTADANDKNKEALTYAATEMLCMKENTFELVKDTDSIKIFKNESLYTGIVLDENAIPALKKQIEIIGGRWSVYVFSLGDDTFEEVFEGMESVDVAPIPEAILRVYRRIFK